MLISPPHRTLVPPLAPNADMEEFVSEEVQLRLTIVPMEAPAEATLSQTAAVDEPFAGRHDSLMQLLLRIACVQPGIVKLLLEKVRRCRVP